ncbi:MAG: glycosyltransferase family 2 protein [Anaerolineales bacterium]|nr:glycosyltransferase family 2 protein [Anaerolineales bacterium]
MNTASIVFHVIYVHGAVRTLLPFLDTLLRWSDCRYCLVANGCDVDELALLRTRCDGEPRLSMLVLPGPEVLGHGAVLNHLYACTTWETFCFMDSDILAVGDFLAVLLPHLPGAAGVFSAWPLSIKASERVLPDNSNHLIGHHSITPGGVHLGGTYLAIYDRAALAVGMAAAPGGFNGCLWSELAEATQAILQEVGQVRTHYDTGRVLNLCLLQRGYRLHVEHTATLCHLGNYSDPFLRAAATPRNGSNLHPLAENLRRAAARLANRMRGRKQAPGTPPLPALKLRKRRIHAYFTAVTRALDAGQPLPALLQVGDAEIDPQIVQATTHLIALYRDIGRALNVQEPEK